MTNYPVDVIAAYSTDGSIRPLRFRMEDEAHRLLCIHIDEVISVKEVQYVGIEAQVFLCRATQEQRECVYELKYTIRTHSWQLIRRVY